MRIVVAALVKNEAHRFWRQALSSWSEFADEIVVVDDNSTDDTPKIATEAGAHVFRREAERDAWGTESPARADLFNALLSVADPGDYGMILDADMCPLKSPQNLLQTSPGAVAFVLYDLWGTDTNGALLYRDDYRWQGHRTPRVWMVRVPDGEPTEGWDWNERGIHTGHFPRNLVPTSTVFAPLDYGLLHWAYFTPELRKTKAAQYEAVAEQLTPAEQQHALSILDPAPTLRRLPWKVEWRFDARN